MERKDKLEQARSRYQAEKELFRGERERLRKEKEELRRLREAEREKYLQEKGEAKAKAKEERREAKRKERRERERNWNRVDITQPGGTWDAPQNDYPPSFMVHAPQFPEPEASGQVPFIPTSSSRSPPYSPQPVEHLNLRGGAGSSPSDGNGFPDNSKRYRRKVADVRVGGKWEDIRDPGSDLEERMSIRSRRSVNSSRNTRLGVEVSLERVLERLVQVGVECNPISSRATFFTQLSKLDPDHPASEELDKELEDELFDWLLEDHIISGAIQPRRQDRIVKIRSSGTFGRVSPYEENGTTGMLGNM